MGRRDDVTDSRFFVPPQIVVAVVALLLGTSCSSGSSDDDWNYDVGRWKDAAGEVEVPHDVSETRAPDGAMGADTADTAVGDFVAADLPEEDLDECNCYQWVCGTTDDGCFCGDCPEGEVCDTGECVEEVVSTGQNGTFCGPTADCQMYVVDPVSGEATYNEGFIACANAQCASNVCGMTSLAALVAPACTQACAIVFDEINNATGAPGPDGIEDPDAIFTECAGFSDGPAGTSWVCANYSAPGDQEVSFCTPGSTFALCTSDADCPATEQCNYSFIGGFPESRCQARLKTTPEVYAEDLSAQCSFKENEAPAHFCESGVCADGGCVNFCASDADCDTTLTLPGTGCDTNTYTCITKPAVPCFEDVDCSLMNCSPVDVDVLGLGEGWDFLVHICWWK